MENLFLKILNMSLTASWVIAVVLVIRALLAGAPKKYRYALWSVVGFRLCCPFSLSAAFSLLRFAPRMQSVPAAAAPAQTAQTASLVTRFVPELTTSALPAAAPQVSADPIHIWITAGTAIWCIGMAAVAIYSLLSYGLMQHKLATATRLRGNIWQSEQVRSPFILGIVRPKIYIPYGLEPNALRYVLTHERCHLARRDHLVKVLAFVLLALHWFNPLCWVAFWLMDRDMEMSCDEKVLERLGGGRKTYSTTLLSFAANRRFPIGTPLAFGENSVKSRIRNALSWRKPRFYVTLTATGLCAAVLVGCAVNPAWEFTKPSVVSETSLPTDFSATLPSGLEPSSGLKPSSGRKPSSGTTPETKPYVPGTTTEPGPAAPSKPAQTQPQGPETNALADLPQSIREAAAIQLGKSASSLTKADLAKITKLDFMQLELTDLAPLRAFPNLAVLDVSCHRISDFSPLAQMPQLRELCLNYTGISDLTPISGLTNLTWLELCNSPVRDISPLSGLKNLEHLRIQDTDLADIAPLAKLTNLKELYIDTQNVTDFSALSSLKNLESLFVEGFTGDLSVVKNLHKVTWLCLTGGSISDLRPISDLTQLEVIIFDDNNISDLTPISGLHRLVNISMGGNRISDLTPLAKLTGLDCLQMYENQISDLTPLAELSNLTHLDLRGNRLTDVSPLAKCTKLVSPQLEGNSASVDELLAQLPDPNLN